MSFVTSDFPKPPLGNVTAKLLQEKLIYQAVGAVNRTCACPVCKLLHFLSLDTWYDGKLKRCINCGYPLN